MDGISDNIGRSAMIAIIAGVLFAGFLALTPRLTAGTQTTAAVGPAPVVTTTPAAPPSTTLPDAPVAEAAYGDGSDSAATGHGTQQSATPVVATVPGGPDPDGTLTMTAELFGPLDGKETVIITDRDTVEWVFRVQNNGTEDLWGVYVYLEGFGQVPCGTTYLAPGDTTGCSAYNSVWAGDNTAISWVTAWTTERQVAALLSYEYSVSK